MENNSGVLRLVTESRLPQRWEQGFCQQRLGAVNGSATVSRVKPFVAVSILLFLEVGSELTSDQDYRLVPLLLPSVRSNCCVFLGLY